MEERLPTPRHPENQRVGNVAGMEVEKIRRAVVGFEYSPVFSAEMRVRLLAGMDRKEKREVSVVRVQQVQLAEVERIVARYGGEIMQKRKTNRPRRNGNVSSESRLAR